MKREQFEQFYDDSVERYAAILCEHHRKDGFKYVRNLNGAYETYLNLWHHMRWLLKNQSGSTSDMSKHDIENSLLDGHKTAACITVAVAQVRLIVNDTLDDADCNYSIHESNRLNEQLAVLSGVAYLIGEMIEKTGDTKNLRVNKDDEFELIWPQTDYDNPPEAPNHYLDSLIRGVFYSGVSSHTDPMLLANIYFLIEQYHRKSVELAIANNKLKSLNVSP